MSSLICLAVLVLWATKCSSLTLNPTTTIITRHDEKFELMCECDTNEVHWSHPEMKITKMRILKFADNNWIHVAQMDSKWTASRKTGISPIGTIDVSRENYISQFGIMWTKWSTSAKEAAGTYVCDAIGYDHNLQKGVYLRTRPIHVDVERLGWYALVELAYINHKKLKTCLGKFETLKESFNKSEKTQDMLYEHFVSLWPQGAYSLLSPESGCPPSMGVVWETGFRRQHTESNFRNQDAISENSHFKKPNVDHLETQKHMFSHFCTVTEHSPRRLWPSGSYCFMRYKETCPIGFNKADGAVLWDDENMDNENVVNGTHPTTMKNDTKIFYCCRNDNSPRSPIQLPMEKPFYLNRYDGLCQEVLGMKVTVENITYDTELNSTLHGNHPDLVMQEVGLEGKPHLTLTLIMCYYEKKKGTVADGTAGDRQEIFPRRRPHLG